MRTAPSVRSDIRAGVVFVGSVVLGGVSGFAVVELLGLVKHLASIEVGCFAWAFDRPLGETFWWLEEDDDAEPNSDMWATEDEPSQWILSVYERTRAHADATIEDHPLNAPGLVPWREPSEVTLHEMLVHMIVETERHLGQADILRESIDGSVGHTRRLSTCPRWISTGGPLSGQPSVSGCCLAGEAQPSSCETRVR